MDFIDFQLYCPERESKEKLITFFVIYFLYFPNNNCTSLRLILLSFWIFISVGGSFGAEEKDSIFF